MQALRGVDLDVYAGEMTLLVGPSGCGKTTLISIIAGILDPTGGHGRRAGHAHHATVPRREGRAFAASNIGFVFQQYNLLPALTAAENVAVPLVLQGWSKRKAPLAIGNAASFFFFFAASVCLAQLVLLEQAGDEERVHKEVSDERSLKRGSTSARERRATPSTLKPSTQNEAVTVPYSIARRSVRRLDVVRRRPGSP